MAKTKEKLNSIKEEVETLNKKLAELTEEELKLVAGGYDKRFTLVDTPGVDLYKVSAK